jgi:hypothetical protein
MYYEIYINRRDNSHFDVPKVEQWVLSLPGAFRRTQEAGGLFIVANDEIDREEWIPLYAVNPYRFGPGTCIQVDTNQIRLKMGGGAKINTQVRRFVIRLLDEYDCIISDGTTDITEEVKANVDVLF